MPGILSNFLVRPKIYSSERSIGLLPCSYKRCKGCKYSNKTESFTSSVTQKTHKTNHRLNCNDKWLIFILNVWKMFQAVCCRNNKILFSKLGATSKTIKQSFKRRFLYSKKSVWSISKPRSHCFHRRCLNNVDWQENFIQTFFLLSTRTNFQNFFFVWS